ncbi:MerR family transcriptional regulator [Streptomycetaceae bacterium NBC_01309]
MRIAELSRATGVPVPTIKYYVREGLLPPGELTSPNQAQYDQGHVRRLKLVRALIEVGGVSVAAVRDAVRRIDAPDVDLHAKLGATHYLLGAAAPLSIDAADLERAQEEADALLADLGWQSVRKNPAAVVLVQALATLHWLGQDGYAGQLASYAEAAKAAARTDFAVLATSDLTDTDTVIESAVVGTVLGDVLLAALRRLAQEHMSAELFRRPAPDPTA